MGEQLHHIYIYAVFISSSLVCNFKHCPLSAVIVTIGLVQTRKGKTQIATKSLKLHWDLRPTDTA